MNDKNNTFKLSIDDLCITSPEDANNSKIGSVYLVRSKNVGSKGDHFIIVTGGLVQKPHGLRPETVDFPANQEDLLNKYNTDIDPLLLQLKRDARERFYEANNIDDQYRIK